MNQSKHAKTDVRDEIYNMKKCKKMKHNTNPLFQWQHGTFYPNTSPPIFQFGTCMFYPVGECLLFCPTESTLADDSETKGRKNLKKVFLDVKKHLF